MHTSNVTLGWLEQLPLGFALVGTRGETLWMNTAAREILGTQSVAETDVLVQAVGDRYPHERLPHVRALAGERVLVRDMVVRRSDREVHVEVSAAPIRSPHGSIEYALLSYRDITAGEERYAHIIENASEIIYRSDHRGRFTYANPAATRITGFSTEELLGMTYLDLVDPEYREVTRQFYQTQFRTRQSSTYYEFPMISKDGAKIWIGQNVLTLKDGDRVTGYEAVARDVTHRLALEEELARSHDTAVKSVRAKSEFLANMSHEIRTPLNGVLGMTGLLLGTPLTPEQREYAETIRSSGEALLSIVNDVLDLAKVEAGKLTIETIDFDLDDLVESIIDVFAERAAAKRLKYRGIVYPDVARLLRGDVHRIRQVLLNLVGNALKFTSEGDVTLTVMQPEEGEGHVKMWFLVTDTGIGIEAATQAKLFTPFTQADGTTTRKYGGSGLGLAVSKQLVEAMGGEIGMASVEGQGSTFWFTLTLEKQSAAAERPVRGYELSSYRALLVDANDVNRLMFSRHLAATSIIVDEAETAAAALERLRHTRYDVVIFEMQLPDEDGLVFARQVRATGRARRLLLLTHMGRRKSDMAAFEAAGIDAFLLKPVRRSQLCESVADLVDESRGLSRPMVSGGGEAPSFSGGTRARILLVEDNPVNQLVALGQLRRLGYECVVVGTGRESIDAVRAGGFDLVLMDCQMPDMDGYDATRAIRTLPGHGDIPIIAHTAHALQGEREKCLAAGMNDYLAKPASPDQLGAIIRSWTQGLPDNRQPTTDNPSEASHEVLDHERINAFLEIGRGHTGFLEGLLQVFRDDVPTRIDALREAIAQGDHDALANAAHALKSSTGNVGARRMYLLAAQLEQDARQGKTNGAAASVDELVREFARANAAFEELH